MDVSDLWRLFNCVIALAALIYLVYDLKANHLRLNRRRLYLTFSLAGMLFAVVVGSIESILQNNHVGLRTAIITASCMWCLTGLWISRND